MTPHPPHLPGKTCSVEQRRMIESLMRLLVVVLVASVAGLSVALATIAWIIPDVSPFLSSTITERTTHVDMNASPDPFFIRQVNERVVMIIDTRLQKNKGFYSADAIVGQGAVLSSDGWIVGLFPSYRSGVEKSWNVVSFGNNVHTVDRAIFDAVSGLVYLHVRDGSGFRGISFADVQKITAGDTFWALSPFLWRVATVGDPLRVTEKSRLNVWEAEFAYPISTDVSVGSLVLSSDGGLAGFISPDALFVPSTFVSNQLASLFETNKFAYSKIDWVGHWVDGKMQGQVWYPLQGFLVEQSKIRMTSSTVGIGDVIIEIEHHPVAREKLREQILNAPNPFAVRVLRGDAVLDMMVTKTTLNS